MLAAIFVNHRNCAQIFSPAAYPSHSGGTSNHASASATVIKRISLIAKGSQTTTLSASRVRRKRTRSLIPELETIFRFNGNASPRSSRPQRLVGVEMA